MLTQKLDFRQVLLFEVLAIAHMAAYPKICCKIGEYLCWSLLEVGSICHLACYGIQTGNTNSCCECSNRYLPSSRSAKAVNPGTRTERRKARRSINQKLTKK